MNKKIVISYNKYSNNKTGTVYDQTIKISRDLVDYINNKIKEIKRDNKHIEFYNSYDYIYLDELEEDNINWLTLTGTRIIKHILNELGINTSRIKKDRNTRLTIVD